MAKFNTHPLQILMKLFVPCPQPILLVGTLTSLIPSGAISGV
jgi:hypothetical protein